MGYAKLTSSPRAIQEELVRLFGPLASMASAPAPRVDGRPPWRVVVQQGWESAVLVSPWGTWTSIYPLDEVLQARADARRFNVRYRPS